MSTTREALEDAWTTRLDTAKACYFAAKAECERVMLECQGASTADSQSAIRKALKSKAAALREYVRVLRVFSKLVNSGTLPPDE